MSRPVVFVGDRFGWLVVVAPAKPRPGKGRRFVVRCDCGTVKESDSIALRQGQAKSCGCQRGGKTRHGHTPANGKQSPTYGSWNAMRQRCTNPNNNNWHNYGGRGITVCDRWHRFDNFLADMGEKPEGRSLDRIDNDGNYEPGNCRWATRSEQRQNQRPRATHCQRGHERTQENTYVAPRGNRECLICRRDRAREDRRKRRELIDPFVCPCCGTDATKLRVLADYVEAAWAARSPKTDVQEDLRQWADSIEAGNR